MGDSGKVHVTSGDVFVMVIRYLLCIIFPPLAVLDKGCGTMLIVFLFTLIGWLPGTILAILICMKDRNYYREPGA